MPEFLQEKGSAPTALLMFTGYVEIFACCEKCMLERTNLHVINYSLHQSVHTLHTRDIHPDTRHYPS
ncbi:hypothetical protein HYPBUDRAFT_231412 [Hyphopichia burtonii NRRL Y-1933]|uniref:Uncharacterized protein n=1 Tax=Hyphopichia burtonii NRRL Y-1933 TaxID=984485 RepID=A0A1E4RDA2_9ASCO|nr:hypothetical protein HYPBUDRAFT_231412 [Hyphopichia burtonii NRRL Y-1933]ODV65206.1 hypothetical protein HYPBUDRAFT_231412 [Hyphopichia burtonii NRRL Y-1933]